MPDQPRDEGRLEAVGGEAEARALAPETRHRQLGERRPRLLLHLLEGGRGGADLCELVAARLGGDLLALLLVLPRALAVALIDRALRLALGVEVLVAGCRRVGAAHAERSLGALAGVRGDDILLVLRPLLDGSQRAAAPARRGAAVRARALEARRRLVRQPLLIGDDRLLQPRLMIQRERAALFAVIREALVERRDVLRQVRHGLACT
mmetsp:Transcript_2133/g.7452  ORF Transcript_2133/g.7452 Transcript_2133/m.7452 type:complete len:208 (-) Transcript_2133:17-640(-)